MRELYLIQERERQARVAALYVVAALVVAGIFLAAVWLAEQGCV